jgi:quinol monooxygenase YgiN
MAVYTSGDWHPKPGREQEFIDAWRELASWSTSEYGPNGWGKLLRDKEDPSHFISVGKWPDAETVSAWRDSEGFDERIGKVRELVEEIRIRIYDPAAEVGSM